MVPGASCPASAPSSRSRLLGESRLGPLRSPACRSFRLQRGTRRAARSLAAALPGNGRGGGGGRRQGGSGPQSRRAARPRPAPLTGGSFCRPAAPLPSSGASRCRRPRSPARTRTCSWPWPPPASGSGPRGRKWPPRCCEAARGQRPTSPPSPRAGPGSSAPEVPVSVAAALAARRPASRSPVLLLRSSACHD